MKYYITVMQSPMYHQMTLEEFLFETESRPQLINPNMTNTRTYETESISDKFLERIDVAKLITALVQFNEAFESVHSQPRETLYNTFYTEKKGKGMPYVFKKIFEIQKSYVECNSSAVCKEVGTTLRKMLTQHSTETDAEVTKVAIEHCVNYLTEHGFTITTEQLTSIVKEAYRRIDAPKDELSNALRQLKTIFEEKFNALYHTAAFAYVKRRSTLDAVKRHQANESKWFGKYDLSNFFGSTTVDFVMKMFSMVFPFSEVVKYPIGKEALETAISLCMLNGGLPQGTPISPLITNIMMIPVDFKLANGLRDFNNQRYIYTRYADDFLVSSRYDFKFREIEQLIVDTLASFDAPFTIKAEKTRYGSSAGRNYNLGIMLNKDNQITVGHQKKRKFQAMLHSFVMDAQNGNDWALEDVRVLEGLRNYYRMIEGDTIDNIIKYMSEKHNVDIMAMIKDRLRA